MEITADTNVEDLLDSYPWSNGVMVRFGLPYVRCGELFWGIITELAEANGHSPSKVLAALNEERKRRSG